MNHTVDTMVLVRAAAAGLALLSLLLVGYEAWRIRRGIVPPPAGRLLLLAGLVLLPLGTLGLGQGAAMEGMKTVAFCNSCHVMTPYVKGLEDPAMTTLSAVHVQNHRVDPATACYTCHSDYSMFGTIKTKLRGLRHVYAFYVQRHRSGTIRMYSPFPNATCLHCHGGARNFEEQPAHAGVLEQLKDESMSCLTCHSAAHPPQVAAK